MGAILGLMMLAFIAGIMVGIHVWQYYLRKLHLLSIRIKQIQRGGKPKHR
jgi:hypothetical protein